MTPRDRHARLRAYARAAKRAHDAMRAVLAGCRGYWTYRRGAWPTLDVARDRQRHAYNRLPEHVRAQILEVQS